MRVTLSLIVDSLLLYRYHPLDFCFLYCLRKNWNNVHIVVHTGDLNCQMKITDTYSTSVYGSHLCPIQFCNFVIFHT